MPLSKIPANGISSIANTAISGNVIASQITSVANTQITGLFTTAQLANTFVEAANATNFTGKQTFTGTTSALSSKFVNALETTTVNTSTWNSTANTINYDITTQSILYYTSNCANNFTINFYTPWDIITFRTGSPHIIINNTTMNYFIGFCICKSNFIFFF